jgi:hypothetical protein
VQNAKPAWLSWIGAAGGVVAILGFLASVWMRSGEFPGLPARMTTVEKNQAEMGRRVDMITADITSMRRDMDNNQRRTEIHFSDITKSLSTMAGVMQDVRDQGMKAAGELSAVREKAVNAAILADDAAKAAMETKAKWDAEHQGSKPK